MRKERRFASVCDAIADTRQAASMGARSALMMEPESIIEQRGMIQAGPAALFGVTQPRAFDLVRGRIKLFSPDCLIDMATPDRRLVSRSRSRRRHGSGLSPNRQRRSLGRG